MNTKQQILEIIYNSFASWSAAEPQACTERCAACCTQNVSITGLEGERILNYIVDNKLEKQFAEKISRKYHHKKPEQTTNQFAEDCFQGNDPATEGPSSDSAPCPFLENSLCTIYPARPFSCRCFISQHQCSPTRSALVPGYYLTCSTVISQLIEHLGQFEYWGNMLDVLPAMLDISAYKSIADRISDKSLLHFSRENTLTAQPLPGFLLTPDDSDRVTPLLEMIFQQKVEGKTVEDILNGK